MQNKCLMGCLEFTATGLDPQIMKTKKKKCHILVLKRSRDRNSVICFRNVVKHLLLV